MHDHLSVTIGAVSLAYYFHQTSSSEVLAEARREYIRALQLTNAALRSSELALKDTTLLATLLLDLFEKFTSPILRDSWKTHVHGALALVKLRGTKQYSDPIGLRMVMRLSINILISFVACNSALPRDFIAVRTFTADFLKTLDPKWKLTDLMVDYAAFRARLIAGQLSELETISIATKLDARYLNLMNTMPPSWRYETVNLSSTSSGVFGDHFHVYPSQHVTQTWNVIRTIRIFLNDTIRETCLSFDDSLLPQDYTQVSNAATECIENLALDICASAPQYLVDLDLIRARLKAVKCIKYPETSQNSISRPQYETSVAYLKCYTLLFPLYVAAQYTLATSTRDWILKQLHHMSSKYCFKNAHRVAEILEREDEDAEVRNPWRVYIMLGSYAFAA
ncbi:hypothetical protein BP5796_01150 [Coleophoma crateriformis]|uniref:Uncharacterized protein n=1 Tax=Coleophoma crateriformis TaxID=565419 RepID=A0A3D8SZN1_9HELO|nr:hypothetical protein BP5796_01150 [Coleophoma crateriformis]